MKSMFQRFPKFDLAIDKVKTTKVHLYRQLCKYSSVKWRIPSFQAIGLLALEKIFLSFLPYMDMAAILVIM